MGALALCLLVAGCRTIFARALVNIRAYSAASTGHHAGAFTGVCAPENGRRGVTRRLTCCGASARLSKRAARAAAAPLNRLRQVQADASSWEELAASAGHPSPRVFEAAERLFDAEAPKLKFWHDASGWCPHCMTAWTVLEEMRIPYVMDTTPLRAYLKPGEKKPARLRKVSPKGVVPIVQFLDEGSSGRGKWVFGDPVKNVGRGEQVCEMLQKRFPLQSLLRKESRSQHMALFTRIQKGYRPYKYLPNGRPTWGVNPKHTKAHEKALVSALDGLEAELARGNSSFLHGDRPYMIDLMLLPYLERVEALLLHPYLGGTSGLSLEKWPRVSKMLAAGRTPGVCSFSELSSDAETLLAISMRDDGARLAEGVADSLVASSLKTVAELSLADLARLAAGHAGACRRDAAARICAKHKAVVGFACSGRGCGRGESAVKAAKAKSPASPRIAVAVDIALRAVVAALLLDEDDPEKRATLLESDAVRCAKSLRSDASCAVPALRFLSLNVGVPRDMSASSAGALRAHLKLLVRALELR